MKVERTALSKARDEFWESIAGMTFLSIKKCAFWGFTAGWKACEEQIRKTISPERDKK